MDIVLKCPKSKKQQRASHNNLCSSGVSNNCFCIFTLNFVGHPNDLGHFDPP